MRTEITNINRTKQFLANAPMPMQLGATPGGKADGKGKSPEAKAKATAKAKAEAKAKANAKAKAKEQECFYCKKRATRRRTAARGRRIRKRPKRNTLQ